MEQTIEIRKKRLTEKFEALLDFYIVVQTMTDPANYEAGMIVYERKRKELEQELDSLLGASAKKKWWQFWK